MPVHFNSVIAKAGKRRLRLAVAAVAAGVAVACYVQKRESAPARKTPTAATAAFFARESARPLRIAAARPSPAALGTAPVARSGLKRPPLTPPSPRRIFIVPDLPQSYAVLADIWPAEKPVNIKLPTPDDVKLWTDTFHARLNDAGNEAMLNFMDKKAGADGLEMLDVSNAADIGLGCRLIKNQDTTVLGRFAGGFSKEYGFLADGQQIPEVLLGARLEHQLGERNKILGAVEYARDVTDVTRCRVRRQAAWELLLDPDRNLSLRTGVEESSNKAPNGERAKSVDYSLDVIWKF